MNASHLGRTASWHFVRTRMQRGPSKAAKSRLYYALASLALLAGVPVVARPRP